MNLAVWPERNNVGDRFCRFGSGYVQAALAAQGPELVVVDTAEVDDDLVRDRPRF
jgi:predicted site-specific integrase-resolvase